MNDPRGKPADVQVFNRSVPGVMTRNGNGGYRPLGRAILTTNAQGIHEPKLEGDVGYDLVTAEDAVLGPYAKPVGALLHDMAASAPQPLRWLLERLGSPVEPHMANIRVGTCVELPIGHWGAIVPRSSANKRGLFVHYGVIDNGYRGPLFALVQNLTRETVFIPKGSSIAQLVLHQSNVYPVVETTALSDSARSTNGFGSTGKSV